MHSGVKQTKKKSRAGSAGRNAGTIRQIFSARNQKPLSRHGPKASHMNVCAVLFGKKKRKNRKKPEPAAKPKGIANEYLHGSPPGTKDKIYAILAAAVIIAAAVAFFLTPGYLKSFMTNQKIADTIQTAEMESITHFSGQDLVTEEPIANHETVQSVLPVSIKPEFETQTAAAVPGDNYVPAAPVRVQEVPPAENRTVAFQSPAGIPERPSVTYKGTLAFVIDDAGNNLRDLEPFQKIPGPITIAVLPGLPNSAEAARRIRAAGKEVFLHQPMESLGGQYPGPGAVMAGMSSDEIRSIISRNLDEVGPVAGMNNHGGSRITMDKEAMETVLAICRERNILFLDSRTTADTVVPDIARFHKMTIGERDIFIDNDPLRESMIGYINSGLVKAEQKGTAIMIGHTSSAALAPLLSELFPDLSSQRYSFSSASEIINGKNR